MLHEFVTVLNLLEAQFPISKKGRKRGPAGVNFFKDLRA